MALCLHLHLLNKYSKKFAPTAAHIKDHILAHFGYEGTSILHLCEIMQARMIDDPNVWFVACNYLIRIELAWEELLTFDSMRAHVSREFPVMCAVRMPGCRHALTAYDKADTKHVIAYNSWGDSYPDVRVTQGGEITMKSMPFTSAMLLSVTISQMWLDGKDMPLPGYVAGYVETAGKSFFAKKGPVDVPFQTAAVPPVPQRVKRAPKCRPRGAKVPWGERVARQVVVTTRTKDKFDRRMALGLKRLIRIYNKWRPGQMSQEMKSKEELSQCVSKFVDVNRLPMEASLHRMKEQLAKRTLLREEKRTRMRLSLKLAQGLPLKANEFDELPPLPENPISDTESETHSVHTLQHECEDEEQDLSNC